MPPRSGFGSNELLGCDQHEGLTEMRDWIVERVRSKLADRSAAGIAKYGTTMERTDLTQLDWLRHAQEELLDGAVYLERLIQEQEQRHGAGQEVSPPQTPEG